MKPASPDFNRRDLSFPFNRVNSDAIANFKRLLEAGRDSALLRFSLGSEYLKIGESSVAVQHLEHAVALDPKFSAAWKLLGRALTDCGRREQALAASELGICVATATAVTVFIISLGYNQVIELFPNGGGGYKVATQLLGPHAGLVSGAALMVDYVLTIAISVASGVDALFSLLPVAAQAFKVTTEVALIVLLTTLNLRGMKESIVVMLPIFLGFFLSHTFLILYGIYVH